MSDNPYQAPEVMGVSSDASGPDLKLDRTVIMLRQTKPWVRFISVMTFIGSGFMVLGGVVMLIAGAVGDANMMGFGAVLGVVYIAMALFYIIPAIFLWQYADRINAFVHDRSTGTLASALQAQKSFWKFVGILMLVAMALYTVFFAFLTVASFT